MSAVVRALQVGRLRSGPWQNHELAEFYRVIDVLGRAGLAVVPDMGVSDEGDPWFAFCHAETGEIIVHCARIDGVFVATSIALNEVFRGNEIRDVINAIMRSKHFALATAVADKRLYLHPAAVFAAFIAAALLFSKQVSAHDLGAAGSSGTPAEGHHHWGKFLAALKSALADGSSGSQSGVTIDPAFSDASQPGSPLPLAVLISAAISLTVPAVGADDNGEGAKIGAGPLDNPGDLWSPAVSSATSFLGNADDGNAISFTDDASWNGATATFGAIATAGPLPETESLTVPTGPTGTAGQADATPSSLPASDGSNDSAIHHFAVLPLHTETAAVIADSAASAQWVPVVHPYELSEISAAALAVFLGTMQPTTLADVSTIATILPLPPASSTGVTPATSATVASPPADTNTSAPADTNTAPAADTNTSPPTTDTQPTGDTTPTQDSAPVSPTPTPTTTTTTTTTPTTTTTVTSPPDDSSSSNISTPPTDTAGDATPASGATAPTVPTTINMLANPIAGLGELLDYALTSHPITATFAVTSSLAAMLVSYTAEIGGPAHLVVFDSNDVFLPAFEFSHGVLFVDDHQLGITEAQAPAAILVTVDLASGAVMTLLGVVDSNHLGI